jgi:hypothetical protein
MAGTDAWKKQRLARSGVTRPNAGVPYDNGPPQSRSALRMGNPASWRRAARQCDGCLAATRLADQPTSLALPDDERNLADDPQQTTRRETPPTKVGNSDQRQSGDRDDTVERPAVMERGHDSKGDREGNDDERRKATKDCRVLEAARPAGRSRAGLAMPRRQAR